MFEQNPIKGANTVPSIIWTGDGVAPMTGPSELIWALMKIKVENQS